MTRIEVNEVATELEYLRWFYSIALNNFVDPYMLSTMNDSFVNSTRRNPPARYEVVLEIPVDAIIDTEVVDVEEIGTGAETGRFDAETENVATPPQSETDSEKNEGEE